MKSNHSHIKKSLGDLKLGPQNLSKSKIQLNPLRNNGKESMKILENYGLQGNDYLDIKGDNSKTLIS